MFPDHDPDYCACKITPDTALAQARHPCPMRSKGCIIRALFLRKLFNKCIKLSSKGCSAFFYIMQIKYRNFDTFLDDPKSKISGSIKAYVEGI